MQLDRELRTAGSSPRGFATAGQPAVFAARRVDNRSRSRIETLRIALFGGLIVLSLVVQDGHSNFAVSFVVLTLSLILSFIHLPNFYRLSMVWTVAYLYVIASEGYFDGASIAREFGSVRYNEASQFLNASNALLLFFHSLFFREPDGNRVRPPPPTAPPGARTGRLTVSLILILTFFYLYISAPAAQGILAVGRVGADEVRVVNVSAPIIGGLSGAAGLSVPAMWMYYLYIVQRKPLWYALIPSVPVFLMQVALGTRFVLLISLLGAAIVYVSETRLNGRSLRRIGLSALGGFVASKLMLQFRTFGLSSIEDLDPIELLDPGGSEGCVTVMTQVVDYFRHHELFHGRSIASISLFWIPRALWADKPTLLGYWFPRTYGSARDFSSGMSVSAGFPADAYVDFGFYGGLVVCAIAGVLAGLLERKVDTMIFTRQPTMVIACCLYGSAFFAVRSPDTAFIVMSGVVAMTLLFQYALRREIQQAR